MSHDCHSHLHVILTNGIPPCKVLVMAGESATNDVDEEVYDNDGNERHEAREASAGDRRAIADADQAGQLDISGEAKTARIQRAPDPPTVAEMSIIDVCRKVARERNARTVLRFAPKTSHQSNGFVEAVHGHIQGLARCCQTQIETNTGIQLSAISLAIPFAIRHAGFILSRFTVRPDGQNPIPIFAWNSICITFCACLVNRYSL